MAIDPGEVVRLHDVEGMSFQAIADLWGVSKSGISNAYYRAMERGQKKIREAIQRSHTSMAAYGTSFSEEEIKGLHEVLEWWKQRQRRAGSHTGMAGGEERRIKRTFRVSEGLFRALEARAEEERQTVTDLLDAAIRHYLER